MFMKKRNWLALLSALCCFAVFICPVSAVVSPDDIFYVYDGADVLSAETEQYILNASVELERKTGAQIVVVTIPSLEGESLEEYATDLFRQWGIGDAEKNNGLLLLCAVEDRQFRVEVGYGLEGDLPDGKTGRMQDTYIIPLLRENKFDEGIRNGYSAFLQEVAEVYDVSISGEPAISYEGEEADSTLLTCLIICVVLSSISNVLFLRRKKRGLTLVFWLTEVAQLLISALVLQSIMNALWVTGVSLSISFGFGSGRLPIGGFHGGFGGGRSGGGGFSGGGGRSGGGGSSRGF